MQGVERQESKQMKEWKLKCCCVIPLETGVKMIGAINCLDVVAALLLLVTLTLNIHWVYIL